MADSLCRWSTGHAGKTDGSRLLGKFQAEDINRAIRGAHQLKLGVNRVLELVMARGHLRFEPRACGVQRSSRRGTSVEPLLEMT